MKRLLFLGAVLILAACSSQNSNEVNIAQLTYREFYEMMFDDYANRVEWHQDDFNQNGLEHITLAAKGDCTSKNRSGKAMTLMNNSESDTIRVIVKTSYSIPNTVPFIANQYELPPGEEAFVTCSIFNLNEEKFELDHEIVVAEIQEE